MEHKLAGKWISSSTFANLAPRNVFHRQLNTVDIDCGRHKTVKCARTFSED